MKFPVQWLPTVPSTAKLVVVSGGTPMSGEQPSSSRDADEELKAFYQEVCPSHQGIADFRAKLLGFLPLASGTEIFLFLNLASSTGTKQYLFPIEVCWLRGISVLE